MSCLQAWLPFSSSFLRARLHKAQLEEEELGSWDATRFAARELVVLGMRFLPALHLAAFYLAGDFYHFAKRIVGLQYVSAPC